MADTADIRNWLKENRPDLYTQRGRLNQAQLEAFETEADAESVEAPQVVEGEVVPQEAETGEVPPEKPKRDFFGRIKKEKEAGPVRRRASLDALITAAWTVGAHTVGRNPAMIPVARCVATQAPAAGMILDDVLKGTIVDKALQPLARSGKKAEAVASIVGPPMIVMAISAQPELYPVLKPVLRELLSSYVLLAGPKIRAAQKREEKLLAELGGDLSTLDAMIESFFAPIQAVSEEPDAAYAA